MLLSSIWGGNSRNDRSGQIVPSRSESCDCSIWRKRYDITFCFQKGTWTGFESNSGNFPRTRQLTPFLSLDSTVLAHVMTTLNKRYNYGLDLFLLSIDEGIVGYRDDSLEVRQKTSFKLFNLVPVPENWFSRLFKFFWIFFFFSDAADFCLTNFLLLDCEAQSRTIWGSVEDPELWRVVWLDDGPNCCGNWIEE